MHKLLITLFSLLLLAGCSHHVAQQPTPAPPPPQAVLVQPAPVAESKPLAEGMASYYAARHHGKRTASGETMNNNALTGAHRELPFGTQVKVTNLNNQRSVIVRINDRGPYSAGRIIDLSHAAATELDMIRQGVAPVSITLAP